MGVFPGSHHPRYLLSKLVPCGWNTSVRTSVLLNRTLFLVKMLSPLGQLTFNLTLLLALSPEAMGWVGWGDRERGSEALLRKLMRDIAAGGDVAE